MFDTLRYGIRTNLRHRGVTLTILLSLCLGVGTNIAIFTVAEALFLRPLPVRDQESLAAVFTKLQHRPTILDGVSYPDYSSLLEHNNTFSSLAAWTWVAVTVQRPGFVTRVNGQLATGNYFDTLGVRAMIGRTFSAQEDTSPGAHAVVVLSHDFWKNTLGSDASIVGKTLTLNGKPYTVIGIGPEGFRGTSLMNASYLWVPSMMYGQILPAGDTPAITDRSDSRFMVFGRLRTGEAFSHAQAELKTIAGTLRQEFPDSNKDRDVDLLSFRESVIDPEDRPRYLHASYLMMAVVGLVALTACVNVANLLLIRAIERRREISIRLAVGAGRRHLIKQLSIETMLLVVTGSALGLLSGYWAFQMLYSIRPPVFEHITFEPEVNVQVLGYFVLLTILTGMLSGLAPIFYSSRPDLTSILKGQAGFGRQDWERLGGVLIVSQVALAFLSLVLALLFLSSFHNIRLVDPGIERRQLAMITIDPGAQGYDQAHCETFHGRVLDRVRLLSGVRYATLAENIPFGRPGPKRHVFLETQDVTSLDDGIPVQIDTIATDYFATIGTPIIQGRSFSDQDREGTRRVLIINEALAAQLGFGREAVGKRIRFFDDPRPHEIIGIAGERKYQSLQEPPKPYLYLPLAQNFVSRLTVFARTKSSPDAVLLEMLREVQSLDPGMPMIRPRPISEMFDRTLWPYRTGASLLSVFAAIVLILTTVGVYGLLSYSISRREREIGLRKALGARGTDVQKLFLKRGAKVGVLGLGVGLISYLAFSRLVASFLFDIAALNLAAIAGGLAALTLVLFFACLIPARRGAKLDPIIALRSE